MGQKVNPIGFRLAVTKDWQSRWFARKANFGDMLYEDLEIRKYVKQQLSQAAVSRVQIERFANRIRVTVYSARPGLVFGRRRAELDALKDKLFKLTKGKEVFIDVIEVRRPELDAQLVAENIATQIERRVNFRRAMKKALQTSMDMGADGIKIRCGGRLNGAELARVESYNEGRVPLHTLRARISYGFAEANTLAGKIGVKVWICLPEDMEEDDATDAKTRKAQKGAARNVPKRKSVQEQQA